MRRRRRHPGPPIPARSRLAHADFGHGAGRPLNHINSIQITNAIALAARDHASGRLVDIGCGVKPYAGVFAPYVTEHVGVDHPSSPNPQQRIDVFAEVYALPFEDASFDTALMSEVLEHLEEPVDALREAHRVLRPDGTIILTTPLMWPLHEEPRDFFRYTPHGLRHVLGRAGFVDVEVVPLAGQWTTLALLSGYALRKSPLGRRARLFDLWLRASHRLAIRMDEVQFESWFSYNHLAVARRP